MARKGMGVRGLRSGLVAGIVWLGALAGCGVPAPGGAPDTFGLDFALPAGAAGTQGAVIFVVDGVNAEIFAAMLAGGELPATRKYFVARGLYAPRAVANVPSTTMANLPSLVTGLLPGHHGVTGNNWFDRNRLIWRDYETIAQKNTLDGDYTARTLYEHFPDRTTFSVFLQPHRGATKFVENRLSAVAPFFFGCFDFVDRLALSRLNIVADVARRRGRFPAVTVCYLLAPDFRAYEHGVRSRQYRRALRHTDRQIGRVLGDLDRAGLLDKLVIALVSDHGMGQVDRHWPIGTFLRRHMGLGLARRTLWENTAFEHRLAYYRRFAAVQYGSGDRYWAICLRRPIRREGEVAGFEAWPVRPAAEDLRAYPVRTRGKPEAHLVDLPAVLADQEAVDAVAYRAGPNRVRVRRKAGEVEFHQPGGARGAIRYRVISGKDPLGWESKVPAAALAGVPARRWQWLQATGATDFPDLPQQILAYFRARRAGDIAVFAAPGWDFSRVKRAGHGGLRPAEMHVPLLLAGPGVRHGRLDTARTVDLVPTLLGLLHRPVPPNLDGRDLRPGPTSPQPGEERLPGR